MMSKELTYNVCHDCQLVGMRNCSEFDKCGGCKTYPRKLRDMVEAHHAAKTSLSIIAEKAFDMGKSCRTHDMERLVSENELLKQGLERIFEKAKGKYDNDLITILYLAKEVLHPDE
jgi:hypothetical protein